MGAACVTLAWNNKGNIRITSFEIISTPNQYICYLILRWTLIFFSDQQLHVVHLEPAPREKCEEVSEVSPHTICTQEKSERSECNVSQTYQYRKINLSFKIRQTIINSNQYEI